VHTAHDRNKLLGWAEITHPFHPRRHQHFKVLKVRRAFGVRTLSLRDQAGGIFAVPQDWTDLAEPSAQALADILPAILDSECLLALVDLIEALDPTGQEKREGGTL